MQQLTIPLALNQQMLFEHFVSGDELKTSLEKPFNHEIFQAFYFYGTKGVGKTHLLQALCYRALAQGLSMAYFDCASAELSLAEVDNLTDKDCICIDNIHLATNSSQQALYQIYNQAKLKHQTLCYSANTLPKSLDIALNDLKTRLGLSLVVALKDINFEQKIQVLMQKNKDKGINLKLDIYQYILSHHSRDLSKALLLSETLVQSAIKLGKKQSKISVAFAKSALKIT